MVPCLYNFSRDPNLLILRQSFTASKLLKISQFHSVGKLTYTTSEKLLSFLPRADLMMLRYFCWLKTLPVHGRCVCVFVSQCIQTRTISLGPYHCHMVPYFLPDMYNSLWTIYWSPCPFSCPILACSQQHSQSDTVQNIIKIYLSFAENLPNGSLSQQKPKSTQRPSSSLLTPYFCDLSCSCSCFPSCTSGPWPWSSSL